ncbi:MAG: hypothetical protein U0667_12680 [Chloroflexota bacterium]
MSESLPAPAAPTAPGVAALVALDGAAPPLEELFRFMVDAELRVRTLRMRILEQTMTARGETEVTHDVLLRDDGRARVTRRRSADAMSRDYDVWSTDGSTVTTYDARSERASVRRAHATPVGVTAEDLPRYAQVRPARTRLPADSVVDAFVHPNGFIRNVVLTGVVTLAGSTVLNGRETFLLRLQHPRSTYVLTDRPDRWVDVGVDRQTGFLTLLVEHIGDTVTRHAEAVSLETDAPIPDDAFVVHLPGNVRRIY